MMKRFNKIENLGITLIALVITIIILLILAGVTIGFAMSGNGLFDKAKLATDEYNNKVQQEETEIIKTTNEINSYINGNRNISNINYSTNEQDTGLKWIDGKTIFQKTLTGTVSNEISSDIGTSIDSVCGFDGYIYKAAQGRYFKITSLDSYGSSTGYCYAQVYNNSASSSEKNKIFIREINTTWFNGDIYYLTVQYTKTTDTENN